MKHNTIYIVTRKNAAKYDAQFNDGKYVVLDKPSRVAGGLKHYLAGKPRRSYGRNYNGYGYADRYEEWFLNKAEAAEYEALAGKKKAIRKVKTDEEKKQEWARRLARLTGIDVEDAIDVANDKLAYKDNQIYRLNERQDVRYSVRRDSLIRSIKRSNPLRRIVDEDHADAILAASRRHTMTSYESKLDEARELAEMGDIDRDEVKDWARQHMY